ncbi:carboxypeptidase S [Ganoderma leucocontextum]|nr:carboxypeptidase S [Ganoderma leucocontextum]
MPILPSHFHSQKDVLTVSYNDGEKPDSGPSAHENTRPTSSPAIRVLRAIVVFCVVLAIPCIHWGSDNRVDGIPHQYTQVGPIPPNENSEYCPQTEPLLPVKYAGLAKQLDAVYADEQFKLAAYKRLSGAVQVPTESYDDLGAVGVDPRWDTFAKLHEYLEETFPKVFQTLEVFKVNTHGIVLRWQGSDPSLLPVLMAAHQDVVPVEPATEKDWIHPPYSGHYDGKWIWGRGSCDDKSDLIASLHAITALIEQGFNPTRTFVWAFGFDEEASGSEGAGHIADFLEKEYGTNGFAALLDEGGKYSTPYGPSVIFATPSLAEKGYLDVRLEVSTAGGHSSVPPPHTAIGILSALLVEIEAHTHTPALVRGGSPYRSTLCAATYGPAFPEPLRALAFKAADSPDDNEALERLHDALLAAAPLAHAVLGTTQAVDVVAGGVKVNALPELASALVNHRIAQHDRVADVQAHLMAVVLPVARRFNLTVDAFGEQLGAGEGGRGHVRLSDAFGTALEPSPVTPTGAGDPYQVLAGTIKATVESAGEYNASGVVVAPQLILGNTDTRYYWGLTKNIFRYRHLTDRDAFNGAHTVNEAIRAEGWIESIRFLTKFILNCDEHL